MSDLVAIVYPSEAKAEEVRQGLLEVQRRYVITIGDAGLAVKTDKDSVTIQAARRHHHLSAIDRRTFSNDVWLGRFLASGGVADPGETAWASDADHCHQQP